VPSPDAGGGAFFLNSGEGKPAITLQTLEPYKSRLKGSVHLGIAGEMNLNILSLGCYEGAIIGAPDNNQRLMWKYVLQLLSGRNERENRKDFIEGMNDAFDCQADLGQVEFSSGAGKQEKFQFYGYRAEQKDIKEGLNIPGHWLYSEESYDLVRRLAKAGKIIVLPLDLMHTEQCKKLGQLLQSQEIRIGSIYTSNMMTFYNYLVEDPGYLGDRVCKPSDTINKGTPNRILHENLKSISKHGNIDPMIIEAAKAEHLMTNNKGKIIFTSLAAHREYCLSIARDNTRNSGSIS
jgi:hypothetical protein